MLLDKALRRQRSCQRGSDHWECVCAAGETPQPLVISPLQNASSRGTVTLPYLVMTGHLHLPDTLSKTYLIHQQLISASPIARMIEIVHPETLVCAAFIRPLACVSIPYRRWPATVLLRQIRSIGAAAPKTRIMRGAMEIEA